MPSHQKMREDNLRFRAANKLLEDEVAALRERYHSLVAEHEDLRKSYTSLQAKHQRYRDEAQSKPSKSKEKWMEELAYQVLYYRKFIGDNLGMPPDIDNDFLQRTFQDTLAYYMRPYSHYAPQLMIPGRIYTSERHCLTCGLRLPHRAAYGKCNNCPKRAWYCSKICQAAHWPVHRYDHNSHRPDFSGFK